MLDAETIAIFSSPPVVVAHNDTCVLSGESISTKSRETPVGHIWCAIATRRPLQDALYVVFTLSLLERRTLPALGSALVRDCPTRLYVGARAWSIRLGA